jgi:pimeloyl-ACP methyl ester carboxylesterase
MQRRIGQVVIESTAAESLKFAAPLVFIHGLWCTAAVWRRFMGFFAHRGWACAALNLRGHAQSGRGVALASVRFADYLTDVSDVLAACTAPPVLVGHDLGGLLALASAPAARAVVALAPVVPRNLSTAGHPLLLSWRARLALACARPLPAPRRTIGAAYFGVDVPGGTTPDSSAVARELARGAITLPVCGAVPALVLAGSADRFAPAHDVKRLAMHVGASFRCIEEAGHALPWVPGWEQRGAEIHRWLIQTLGDGLLLLREEDDER